MKRGSVDMAGVARRNGYYIESFFNKFDETKDAGHTKESARAVMNEHALLEIRKAMEEGSTPSEMKKDIKEILRMLNMTYSYCSKHLED